MPQLPRIRQLKLTDLPQATQVIGEFFRDVVAWMTGAPDVQVKSARILSGQPFTVTFRFKPNALLVVGAIDEAGDAWAVEPVPEWEPTADGARVLDIGGIPSGQRFGITFKATKGGT